MSIFGKLFGKKRKPTYTYSSYTYSSPSVNPTHTPDVSDSEDLEFSHNSDGTMSLSGIGQCIDLEVSVPAKHDYRSVTQIGEKAFYENVKITDAYE